MALRFTFIFTNVLLGENSLDTIAIEVSTNPLFRKGSKRYEVPPVKCSKFKHAVLNYFEVKFKCFKLNDKNKGLFSIIRSIYIVLL